MDFSSKGGFFDMFAKQTAYATGRPFTFGLAFLVIVVWAITGPIFGYSDTWQLVINTGTTIITFLMVFLIQNSQNRDSQAVQLKLDELIRATKGAHVMLLDLEEISEKELQQIKCCYTKLAKEGREALQQGDDDTDVPTVDVSSFGTRPK
jgi:low affinity Fe/Cu permease